MYRNHTIAVVVPAYNEAGLVGDVIRTVPEYVDRVYVVDDGSTDGTWTEIAAAATAVNESTDGTVATVSTATTATGLDERVVTIRHDENRGVGGAIKTGYLHAREDGIDVTAVMGGDGQMRPEGLAAVIDPIVEGRADYAKGNRLHDPETAQEMPRFRLLGNRVLTLLTKIASGYWGTSDPQNGYTAISLDALEAVDIEEMYEFYGYCNDLLVKCNTEGLRVADVPRAAAYDDEESHISLSTYVPRVSTMLLTNFLGRLRDQYLRGPAHPAWLSYATGLVTGIAGVGLALAEAVDTDGTARSVGNALSLALVGCLAFLLGTILERDRFADRTVVAEPQAVDTGERIEAEGATTDGHQPEASAD
ncbi:Glycosyl transferase family 2 [Halorientalis persicus]|uniref:Glycosyl transferase family 2 n=1 Tax=Halorientalis persicus TaxID=1367881 RepID=A0A1H8SL57_9EURY|nr:glycosyltransferase family 2 protein [Halorientalis persicus]SEO79094.1 Glycosyl transferase family 2 [Halorientalis persicus]